MKFEHSFNGEDDGLVGGGGQGVILMTSIVNRTVFDIYFLLLIRPILHEELFFIKFHQSLVRDYPELEKVWRTFHLRNAHGIGSQHLSESHTKR